MSDGLTKEEFCARFKAKLLAIVGPVYFQRTDDEDEDAEECSTADYADEVAPTYWDTPWQRDDGPEECAVSDHSYWEE
jgi:hypothetical protein